MSLRMFCLELALAISLISLGSNQTLFLPHFITLAANRFWSFKELMVIFRRLHEKQFTWNENQIYQYLLHRNSKDYNLYNTCFRR